MSEHREDTPLRRAVVTAWALGEGYTVEPTTWWAEREGIEAWEWTDPDGNDAGEEAGDHSHMPVMPDGLFAKLNVECRWQGVW